MSNKIGNIDCTIAIGDITTQQTDTMLVPVPQTHAGKGGVYEAAKNAGAIAGCEMLENWHGLSSNFMRLGETLTAIAGGGNTQYLTHVASVCEHGTGKDFNFAAVVVSMQSVLEDMQKHGLTSVTVPLMGTGQQGWLDTGQSARAMLTGVQQFAVQHPDATMNIVFCTQDEGKAGILQQTLDNPASYTDVSPNVIIAERGKAIPAAFDVETHRTTSPLAMRLPSAPPKFSGPGLPGRP